MNLRTSGALGKRHLQTALEGWPIPNKIPPPAMPGEGGHSLVGGLLELLEAHPTSRESSSSHLTWHWRQRELSLPDRGLQPAAVAQVKR